MFPPFDHCARAQPKKRAPRRSQLSRELLEPVLAYFGPHGEFDEETIINEALPPPYLIKKDGGVLFIDPRDAWVLIVKSPARFISEEAQFSSFWLSNNRY